MSAVLEQSNQTPASNASLPPAIECVDLEKRFIAGKQSIEALRGVDFTMPAGSVTALIGPDGAGKTTLMRLAAGLMHPDRGRIRIFGADTVVDPDGVRSAIGYMPQHFGLYEDLTVQENLNLFADLQGVLPKDRGERFETLLAMGGLAPFTRRLAGRLSGGMKQKLGLICTLLRTPKLLLLDEPTVGVDPVSRQELWAIIKRVTTEDGMSVLMSTAYLDEAQRGDGVLVLHEGKLLAKGTPDEFTQRLSGRVFTLDVHDHDRRAVQRFASQQPGVVDALLRGSSVRLVLESGKDEQQLAKALGQLEPTPPRFEDAFIDLLGSRSKADTPPAQSKQPFPTTSNEPDRDEIIRVDRVCKLFGTFKAVNNISFTVERGEVFGLLGANGAGKTTCFRMLCGLLPSSEGMLRVAGVDMRRARSKARARIGYMSQGFALYRELTVARNLRFFAGAYSLHGKRLRTRMDWAINEFELGSVLHTKTDELSLGYKQRLAFACSLMHEPEILFLDEPTSGVDPLARREFWRRIDELSISGVTTLVTTHFMEEAEYCDRLVIMVAGELAASGTPDEIRALGSDDESTSPNMEDAFLSIVRKQKSQGDA
jgi:drug efflux transport system ATP-binding protein